MGRGVGRHPAMCVCCRDNVVWDGDQEAMAREKVAANSRTLLSDDQQGPYHT